MKVTQLYTYPIKSLRGIPLPTTPLTKNGFPYDRIFMLLKVLPPTDPSSSPAPTYQAMLLSKKPYMMRFWTAFSFPSGESSPADGRIIVTHRSPGEEKGSDLSVPLFPATAELEVIHVDLYGSVATAYDMGAGYNEFFTRHFGYEVKLVYIGANRRPSLFDRPRDEAQQSSKSASSKPNGGWLSSITSAITGGGQAKLYDNITFADCSPYMITSEKSLEEVSKRLSGGQEFDMRKFRPNIVVSGGDEPWDEDFWSELTFNPSASNGNGEGNGEAKKPITLDIRHNCNRCVSINIDYDQGEFGTDEAGSMLKKLMKDRRVDSGMKYSPTFGRLGWLDAKDEGGVVSVGDEVQVTGRNKERTIFSWELKPTG